jgi:p-cumate 2,3-dioxygenase beta subunit
VYIDKKVEDINRHDIEDFLYYEASLLDDWKLDEWLELCTEDCTYQVPPNDVPDGDPKDTLFIIADDYKRLKSRIKRLKSRNAHAENPKSRTKRMISNVRILERKENEFTVQANFVVYRFRRYEDIREYVGHYEYKLIVENNRFKIAARKAVLTHEELASLCSVSILL